MSRAPVIYKQGKARGPRQAGAAGCVVHFACGVSLTFIQTGFGAGGAQTGQGRLASLDNGET